MRAGGRSADPEICHAIYRLESKLGQSDEALAALRRARKDLIHRDHTLEELIHKALKREGLE